MKVSEGFSMADSRNLPKVDYLMLLEYMRGNDTFNVATIRGAKVLISSRDSYVETSVGYVEVKRHNSLCYVKGRVTPEHRVRCKMYTVIATIDEVAENICEVQCQDCAASEGGCKHSICFIMWLIKRTDEPSVTEVNCYWSKPKLSTAVAKDRFVLAKEMGKRKEPVSVVLPDSLKLNSFIEVLKNKNEDDSLILNYKYKIESLNNFAIFQLMLEFNNSCPQHSTDFDKWKEFSTQRLTTEKIEEIEKQTRLQVDSQLWHTLRQGRITASKIYECTRCQTDGVLVKSILGGYKVPETRAIKRGKILEKEVKKVIEQNLKIKIDECGFKLITPLIGASPDGICKDQGFVIEIKCPINDRTSQNYFKNDIISEKCRAQLQIQMYATRMKKSLFCVADPNFETNKQYKHFWIYYDRLYAEKLLCEAELFWKNYIYEKILHMVKN